MARIANEAQFLLRASFAHMRVMWLETARFKSMWLYQFGWSFLFFVPLALTGMAYGDQGFKASGGGSNFLAYAVTGYVALGVAMSALWGGQQFMDRSNQTGTLAHVWVSEAPRWTALAGASVVNLGFAAFRGLLVLVIAGLLFQGAPITLTAQSISALVITLVVFFGMGVGFAGLGLVSRGGRLPDVLTSLAMIMAGATYPIAILPWSVRWIAYVNPYTYIVDLLRTTTIGTPSLFALEIEFLIVAAVALASVTGGAYAYAKCERIAIKRGLVGLHA
ncbi:MAG: ABC transporter permease [Rhodospirillaceae bacterium]|nr:ABC transporter permease [Rhodospirillaceae bacterium]